MIAVDAGGTHTRVACFGLDGTALSAATGGGGSRDHDDDAARNVTDALTRCLDSAQLDPADAVGLAAGMAAVHRVGSNQGDSASEWTEAYFALPGLACPRVIVNDAVTAHRGALLGQPGVIVVAGTGSMILASTETGLEVESGEFEHYAGGARHLVFDAIQQVVAGAAGPADADLVDAMLAHWEATDLDRLRYTLLGMAALDRNDVKRRYGAFAPTITALADRSPIADRALRRLTDKTARGVGVLTPLFAADPVSVSTTGSLATDPDFAARLADSLADQPRVRLVPAALGPLAGAALLAYEAAGLVDDQLDSAEKDLRHRNLANSVP